MGVSLSTLRTEAKQRADMIDSDFVTDSEWNSYINKGWSELYDILIASYEDYFTEGPVEFTLTSGQFEYTLTDDFYKLRGLDFKVGGQNEWTALEPFMFNERNEQSFGLRRRVLGQANVRYRIVKDKIRLVPEDEAPGDYRIWYFPEANTLSDDSDEIEVIAGWEEYVVLYAAILALDKEESDSSKLDKKLSKLKTRIENMAPNRDSDNPQRIQDVGRTISGFGQGWGDDY